MTIFTLVLLGLTWLASFVLSDVDLYTVVYESTDCTDGTEIRISHTGANHLGGTATYYDTINCDESVGYLETDPEKFGKVIILGECKSYSVDDRDMLSGFGELSFQHFCDLNIDQWIVENQIDVLVYDRYLSGGDTDHDCPESEAATLTLYLKISSETCFYSFSENKQSSKYSCIRDEESEEKSINWTTYDNVKLYDTYWISSDCSGNFSIDGISGEKITTNIDIDTCYGGSMSNPESDDVSSSYNCLFADEIILDSSSRIGSSGTGCLRSLFLVVMLMLMYIF